MPNNLVIFPVGGSGGGPTTDIYAAARVVSLIPGQGTDLTLASAIAALAATGGDIYVKPGTYPIAATLTLPAGVFIRIRGAGNGRTGGAPQGATVLVVDPGIELFDCTSAIGASFADFMVIGDAGATDQAAFVVNASIDVIVERVDIGNTAAVDSLRTIVRTGSTPEVTFRDCKVVMPSLGGSPAGSSFWRGSVSGGLLTWDNVEVECAPPFGDPALDFIKATPDFTVIDSYFGAPSGFVQIITGKVIWTGFKLDNAEVYIGGENSRITACEFSAVGVSLNAPTVKIVGTRFNGPGHDPAVSLAQLTLYGVGLQGDYVISGCSFRGAGATNYAIDIRGVFLGGVFGTVIDGCIFDDHSLATITVRGISTYTVTGCLFRSAPLPILETDAICAGQIGDNAILASGDMTIISPNTIVNQWNTRTIVVDTALDIGQRTALVDASGLPIQITLPLAAAARYRQYTIKKIDATANTVTITPSGGELIDGALTVVIGAQYGSVTIQSDGTSWSIIVSDASVSGSDIYAATRIVSLIPGEGTDLTIAAAIAALPAEGGYIQVKQGVYPLAVTNVMPDKNVVIRGAGDGTVISLGLNAIAAFTIPDGLTAERIYTFEDFKITATVALPIPIDAHGWSVQDSNSRGVLNINRVDTSEIKSPFQVTDGSDPVLINATDCHFQQLADNSSILIVNSPSFPVVNLAMLRVRFYRDFNDTVVVGALTQGGFYANFTNVNIIGKDSYFSNGSVDCTLGALNLENCFVFNYTPLLNTRIAVADDNFAAITSAVVGCSLSFVDFDLAGTGTAFTSCRTDFCSFKDTAVSSFTDCTFTGIGGTPSTSLVEGVGDTRVMGCYFFGTAEGTDYVILDPAVVDGCVFQSGGGAALAVIGLPNSTAIISDNYFGAGGTSIRETGGVAHSNISGNNFIGGGPVLLLLGGFTVFDNERVATYAGGTITPVDFDRTLLSDATSGAKLFTLPLAATVVNRVLTFKKIDASVNTVTIDASGAETIDGALTVVLTLQWERITVQSNGTAWFRID